MPQHVDGKATVSRTLFRLENAVATRIHAKPEGIWNLLTNASDHAKWNSTIVTISGNFQPNGKVHVVSKLDPKRTFKLKISEFVPPSKLVWRDGFAPVFSGVRTYSLTPNPDGSTTFSMVEVLSGLMLPMIAGSLPDFKPNFERIAADLKEAAETN